MQEAARLASESKMAQLRADSLFQQAAAAQASCEQCLFAQASKQSELKVLKEQSLTELQEDVKKAQFRC
jgi:hypothetical protein